MTEKHTLKNNILTFKTSFIYVVDKLIIHFT